MNVTFETVQSFCSDITASIKKLMRPSLRKQELWPFPLQESAKVRRREKTKVTHLFIQLLEFWPNRPFTLVQSFRCEVWCFYDASLTKCIRYYLTTCPIKWPKRWHHSCPTCWVKCRSTESRWTIFLRSHSEQSQIRAGVCLITPPWKQIVLTFKFQIALEMTLNCGSKLCMYTGFLPGEF